MIPDGVKIIGDALRAALEGPFGARVVTRTPSSTLDPWVRITQLDAPTVGDARSDHLIEFYVQADCYAGKEGGYGEASDLGRSAREALVGLPAGSHSGAVITGVAIRSMSSIPDVDFEPARDRIILTAAVWAHAD